MMFSGFQLPNITDSDLRTEKEIKEIKDYLYQLQEQLRFVLNNIDLDNLSKDLATQAADTQSMIEKTRDRIALLVSENNGTDQVNAAAIIVAINKGESTAKIIADKIALEGIVTVNGRFWIDENGKMGANGAEINGLFESNTTDIRGDVWKSAMENGRLMIYKNGELSIELDPATWGYPVFGLYNDNGDLTAEIASTLGVLVHPTEHGTAGHIRLVHYDENNAYKKNAYVSPFGIELVDGATATATAGIYPDKSLKLGPATLTEAGLEKLLTPQTLTVTNSNCTARFISIGGVKTVYIYDPKGMATNAITTLVSATDMADFLPSMSFTQDCVAMSSANEHVRLYIDPTNGIRAYNYSSNTGTINLCETVSYI